MFFKNQTNDAKISIRENSFDLLYFECKQFKGVFMSITIVPGFVGTVQIKNNEDLLLEKKFSSKKEMDAFTTKYGKSKPGWNIISGAFSIIRTDNCKNFSEDLFLPTVFNFALTVNDFAVRIFAIICALAFDVITFPLRLIMMPVRLIKTGCKPENPHPLIELMNKTNDKVKHAIEKGVVRIYLRAEVTKMIPKQEGELFEERAKQTAKLTKMRIALRDLPGGILDDLDSGTEEFDYFKTNGEWKQGPGSSSSSGSGAVNTRSL